MSRASIRVLTGLILITIAGLLTVSHRPVSAHQPHDPIVVVAVSPAYAVDRTVFLATSDVTVTLSTRLVMKSIDGGLSWRVVPDFPNYEVSGLEVSPGFATDRTVFAATRGGGLLKSTDGGDSWLDVGATLGPDVVAVEVSPHYPANAHVFAANASGQLFKSSDGGSSWIALAAGVSGITAIAVSPAYAVDGAVIVGTPDQGVVASADGGATWNALNAGLGSLSIGALAFSPTFATDRTIFAGTTGAGVFARTPGAGWVSASQGITDPDITALAFSSSYAADGTMFAATRAGGVFKSADQGASWVEIFTHWRDHSDQTNSHYRSLAVSPDFAADRSLFVASFEGLWKTQDGGNAWRYLETLPPSLVRSMSASPTFANDRTIFASTYGGGMIRSADGGASWANRNAGLVNCYPDATAISPGFASDGQVFAGTVRGLQRLVDGQRSWRFFPMLGVPVFARSVAVSPDFAADQTLFMGTDNLGTHNPPQVLYQGAPVSTDGLFTSTDGGVNWAPTAINGTAVHSIAISPDFSADGTMFAASVYFGLSKSTDRGISWTKVPGPLGLCCTLKVVVSPGYASDRTVFVGVPAGGAVQAGLYRSTDGGQSWTWLAPSADLTVLDLALSPSFAADQTLFVGTLERGVLTSTDGGVTLAPTTLTSPFVTALEISPAFDTDATVFAAAYEGIARSVDGGSTWTFVRTTTRFEDDRPSIVRNGGWALRAFPGASCGAVLGSSTAGDTLQFAFVGNQVTWLGVRGPGQGIAHVYVDGALQAVVDLYGPAPSQPQQVLYRSPILASRAHALTIAVTGQRNPDAVDAQVTFDAFDVSR